MPLKLTVLAELNVLLNCVVPLYVEFPLNVLLPVTVWSVFVVTKSEVSAAGPVAP